MSATKRLMSGTFSSWARIGVTMITQVLLVPIFLSYWDVKTYGIWIAIQALVNVFSTLDRGYNDYLQFEFLKLGTENRAGSRRILWSGISVTIFVGMIEFLAVYFISLYLNLEFLFSKEAVINQKIANEISWSLIIQWLVWTFTNIVGLFFRALSPFGHYPRMGWWNVVSAIVISVLTLIAIINGETLLGASIWSALGAFFIIFIQFIDIFYLLRKENISKIEISVRLGFINYITSITLSGRYFLENFRQQGLRLLLSPISGAAGLAAFTTMRTGANVALQGLSTITNPLMPELMRFLRNREQEKVQIAFNSIWLIILIIMAPSVLIVQAIAPYIFTVWTNSQIIYNPYLFAMLSLSVLIYGLAQPATAIVVGNNLLKVQIQISLISSVIVILGIFILVPYVGILGAGCSLLIAEIIAAYGFQYYAKEWLYKNDLVWPIKSSYIMIRSILITSFGMLLICIFPNYNYIWSIATLFVMYWNIKKYWKTLPPTAIEKFGLLLDRIPFFSKFYYSKIV